MEYAGFWRRLVAYLLDSFFLFIFGAILGVVFGFVLGITGNGIGSPVYTTLISGLQILSYVINISYFVYFTGSTGQTPGKMIMKIKVIKLSTKSNPGYVTAFLREIVGKIISAIVLGLGFLWVGWDAKKQGWHDKIADTVVVKV